MKGFYILWKTGAPVANPGKQEALPYPGIRTHPDAHLVHIRPHLLAEIGDLVHKGDLGSQKGVGGIFGQLCRLLVHHDHRVARPHKRLVELLH